jgi:hypothetical protein
MALMVSAHSRSAPSMCGKQRPAGQRHDDEADGRDELRRRHVLGRHMLAAEHEKQHREAEGEMQRSRPATTAPSPPRRMGVKVSHCAASTSSAMEKVG